MNNYKKNLCSIFMMISMGSVTVLKPADQLGRGGVKTQCKSDADFLTFMAKQQAEQSVVSAQPAAEGLAHQAQSLPLSSSKCTDNCCVLGCLGYLKAFLCIRMSCCNASGNDEAFVGCDCIAPRCPWKMQFGLSCFGCCCDECHNQESSHRETWCPLYCGTLGNRMSEKCLECKMSCKRKS